MFLESLTFDRVCFQCGARELGIDGGGRLVRREVPTIRFLYGTEEVERDHWRHRLHREAS